MVRHSLNYVSWKQRKEVAADLKTIYQAPTVEMAAANLEIFAAKMGCQPSAYSEIMAEQLGTDHSAVLLSAGDSEGDLHDQCH